MADKQRVPSYPKQVLRTVSAIRFDGRVKSGRTKPVRLTCIHPNSVRVELIAKFSACCDRKAVSLAMECIAAMLATDLDLPVPEPFLVELDSDFVGSLEEDNAKLIGGGGSTTAFGSRHLPPGYTTWPAGKSIPKDAIPTAAEIFAFDLLIANDDRRPGNPNCLFSGSSLAIFDHEMAFFTKAIIGWQPPWVVNSLDAHRTPGRHIFSEDLRGRPLSFDRLAGAWMAISDARLEEYWAALPECWECDVEAEEALSYIGMVRDNIEPALHEVRRVLA